MESPSFLDHLKISGLLADEQLADVSGRFSNSDLQVVVAELVRQGLLTPFQVKQLHEGQPKGLVLGQYHLLDELGRGGYGCVYKARHQLMNRIVALKVIAPERVEDSHARAWFCREVLATTQLAHPNIALAYDADEIDGVLFFAMEFIDGMNLEALVRQRGPVPIGTACEMLLQTAKALHYAHEKGMVHRDIKPANLLIPRGAIAEAASDFRPQTFAGTARPVLVKVVDFGLARLQSSSSNNTLVLQNERGFVGTPAYVSPEQARNVHEVDIRSDLYSLGCTFYHALAGQAPFRGHTPLQIVVQHLEKEPEPIERLRPEIPSALASIIRRLMAKKPEKRFQTPAEVLGELGFFYTLDRSGLQKSIPFAPSEPVRSLQPDARAEAPLPVEPEAESHYAPTRFTSWENQEKPTAPPSHAELGKEAAPVLPESDSAPPPTVFVAREVEGTIPGVIHDLAAPAEPCTHSQAQSGSEDRHVAFIDQDLIRRWNKWAGLIGDLAAGRSPGLDDAAYRVLHRRLLESCKAQAERSDRTQAALFQQIAEVVQPWLTLPILVGIDRETLASLQTRCHAIATNLGQVGSGSWKWAISLVLLLLVASAGFFLIEAVYQNTSVHASSWSGLIQRNPLVTLAILLPAVLITSAVMMNFLLRVPRRD